jgi:hypothetical protein
MANVIPASWSLAGHGLAGQHVRTDERAEGVAPSFCWKLIRLVPGDPLDGRWLV